MIKVPREDGECESGYAVLDKAMFGTVDAAQCFDVACEDAMTAMRFSTEVFSPPPFDRLSGFSLLRHGDDFVVLSTTPQQKEFQENYPNTSWSNISMGQCAVFGDVKEVRILNRIVGRVKPPVLVRCVQAE